LDIARKKCLSTELIFLAQKVKKMFLMMYNDLSERAVKNKFGGTQITAFSLPE